MYPKGITTGRGFTLAALFAVTSIRAQQYEDWKPHVNCWCSGFNAGKIVKHKEFNGTPLYWKTSYWAAHDEVPGDWVDSGGTSAWEMLNTMSIHTEEEYKWVGWNSGCKKFKIYKPKGTHDITLELDGTWGDQLDKKGPGVYVPTWRDGAEAAYSMILDEFGKNSYEEYYEPALEVAQEYPEINFGLGTIAGKMDDTEWKMARVMAEEGLEILNSGYDTQTAYPMYSWFYENDTLPMGSDLIIPELQNLVVGDTGDSYDSLVVSIPFVSYASGTADTQYVEKLFFVKEYVQDITDGVGNIRGFIKPNSIGWSDTQFENVPTLKLLGSQGWALKGDFDTHIQTAREIINRNVYEKVNITGQSQCEYFVYRNDLFANETHDSLIAAGYVGAKGGSLSGLPTSGDFYDPYRTTYDNFYMLDAEGMKVFPENPFMRLSLQGLVDNLIKSKGYMTRHFTGCADVESWAEVNAVPGSLPKSLFAKHFKMLDEKRRAHEITVGTPSEIAKYRIMADAVKSATLVKSPNNHGYILHAEMDSVPEQYRCDISFIVKFEEGHDYLKSWHYTSHEDIPLRYEPRKMDDAGTAWSISFNPFHGDLYYKPHSCIGEECDHPINKDGITSVLVHSKAKLKPELLKSAPENLSLNLPRGEYSVSLYSISGRIVTTKAVQIDASFGRGVIPVGGVAQGVYLLSVENSQQVVLQEKIIIK